MQVSPYLFFDGRCEEAVEFYKKTLGAKVEMLMRFKESPEPHMHAPGSEDKIMHGSLYIGDSNVMVSDGRNTGQPSFHGFALTISTKTVDEADKIFAALGEGGQVTMPQTKTFFSPRFGMLADKFGIGWMVIAMP